MKPHIPCFLLFLLLSSGIGRAQDSPPKPVSFQGFSISDSLEYNARSIDYNLQKRQAVMQDNATVKYKGYVLKSNRIVYHQDQQYAVAEGKKDSTGALVDTPVFIDKNGEEMHGEVIEYDLATGTGVVTRGRTKYENGYMTFSKVKRVSADTLFIANGTYTTCDDAFHPHYYFAGKEMKLIVNDKLIIKPITAYIEDIPVFWFPFYVFPISKGRQSGFLTPRYGASRRDGRYLSNIGYYFVPSDYWDYRAAATLRERNGWLMKNWLNYNVRYKMTGSVYASFDERSGEGSRQWLLQASHSQDVNPTLRITGDANFQSSQFTQLNSYNFYERLNRNIRSTLNATKRWEQSGNSLTATLSHEKNLDSRETNVTLPNVSFRMPTRLLFGSSTEREETRKYVKGTAEKKPEDAKWYNSIYYSLNADVRNTAHSDTTRDTFSRDMRVSTSLSSSNKFRGWLVAQPSLNLDESFSATNSVADSARYVRRDNLTFGLGLGTTIYGTFQPKIGSVAGIRHVITPSATWRFGKSREFFSDSPTAYIHLDRNTAQNDMVNGIDFDLRNVFQVKTVKGDKENKFDLLTLNFSTGVDFEAEDRKLSNLVTTLDFRPTRIVSTRLTASHSFYHRDNRFDLLSPTMNSFAVSTDVGITPESFSFLSTSRRDGANSTAGRDDLDLNPLGQNAAEGSFSEGSTTPFNLRFSHTYGLQRDAVTGKYRTTHDIKPEISFSPSPNMSVNYYLYYDLANKELVSHRLSLYRNLHCFEASLTWIPSGVQEGFYFRVNIKDLPDVKLEKRRGSANMGY